MRISGRAGVACAALAAVAVQLTILLLPQVSLRLTAALMLAVTVWSAVQHVRVARRDRGPGGRVWLVSSAGLLMWVLAQLAYARYEVLLNRQSPHPSLADVPNLLAFVFAVGAMLMTATAPRSALGKIRMVLDGALLATALFGLAWLVLLQDAITNPEESYGGFMIGYPIAAVLVLAIALLLIAGAPRQDRGALKMFSSGIAFISGGIFFSVVTSALDLVPNRSAGDVAIMVGTVLIGLAAHQPLPDRQHQAWEPTTFFGRILPYLPIAVIFLCSLYVRVSTGAFDPVLAWTAYVLVATVLARQFLALWLNGQLTRELEQQRGRLAHQARHDPLTGLANRALLADRLNAAVADAEAGGTGREPALLLVDLDGFKAVNDSLGHAAGDELLVAVAGQLRGCAGPADTVARLGGDEFALLLPAVEGAADVADVAEQIIDRLSAPVTLVDGEVTVRASVGGALADPADRTDADRLLRDADVALYAAKADGKGRYRLADAHLRANARDQMRLDRQLRGAVGRGELEVHYQPIIELSSSRVTGAEALLRWRHPERGLLAPGTFLPAAESAGLMPDIDRWVLREACRQAVEWRHHTPHFSVSVNISAGHLTNTTLVRDVTAALTVSGLPPAALLLELTETALVTDTDVAATVLAELAALGVRVALDDFGTGYSSLTYLRSLPIHTIKIDRSFISGLGDGAANDAVTRAILDLAGTLGLHQVAEGVETDDQASRLRGLQCTYGQGYHFSRPVPPTQLSELLVSGADAPPQPPHLAAA
jgi:diguanylate cyclase (GGDEF)-like protein